MGLFDGTEKNLFHILIVGPLLLYIGIMGNQTPDVIFTILTVTATIMIVYHSLLTWNKIEKNKVYLIQ